jgi:hypothetical protein
MHTANRPNVIPFPGRTLPKRTVEWTHTKGARRVDVIREEWNGAVGFYVLVVNIFTDTQTVIGSVFWTRNDAVLQAREEVR